MKVKRLYNWNNVTNNHRINDLVDDSRNVKENDCFYAIKGEEYDGHQFIEDAISKGAKTIVHEDELPLYLPHINYLKVTNIRKHLALDLYKLKHKMFSRVKIIAVTGTNGKTTTTTLLYKYMRFCGISTILIGTNGIEVDDYHIASSNTTPGITEIYKIITIAYQQKIPYIIMEASSQAIKMMRLFAIPIDIAAFTNLTQDHLDYHKTMDDYLYTKGIFLKDAKMQIINSDDDAYFQLDNIIKQNPITYGEQSNDNKISEIKTSKKQTTFILHKNDQQFKVTLSLLGKYNVYNATCMMAIADSIGLFNERILEFLSLPVVIPGRLEHFKKEDVDIYIDYAHSPDAIKNVLEYLRSISSQKLICVFGAGGNRDKAKRKIMGEMANIYADLIILTSDNSRSESPQRITKMIAKGIECDKYNIVINRRDAISYALSIAKSGDVVAILGRGNEEYMIEGTEKIAFNDISFIKSLL